MSDFSAGANTNEIKLIWRGTRKSTNYGAPRGFVRVSPTNVVSHLQRQIMAYSIYFHIFIIYVRCSRYNTKITSLMLVLTI